jgi:hypothetical protein
MEGWIVVLPNIGKEPQYLIVYFNRADADEMKLYCDAMKNPGDVVEVQHVTLTVTA